MSTLQTLENQAIKAAKDNDWKEAIALNQEILEHSQDNIAALNRLGFALLQLGKLRKASQVFNQVLKLEKHNPIAQKQLNNIKNKIISSPQFQAQNFVEEPSKSKIISLSRLSNRQTLESLHVGQELSLRPKNRFISVETLTGVYIGSMPENISLRLSRLITSGNKYLCQLHSSSSHHCSIFVKEIYQSPVNAHKLSFDSVYQEDKDESIGSDLLLLADDVPINIVQDDADSGNIQDIKN